jgi:hypothetical protein
VFLVSSGSSLLEPGKACPSVVKALLSYGKTNQIRPHFYMWDLHKLPSHAKLFLKVLWPFTMLKTPLSCTQLKKINPVKVRPNEHTDRALPCWDVSGFPYGVSVKKMLRFKRLFWHVFRCPNKRKPPSAFPSLRSNREKWPPFAEPCLMSLKVSGNGDSLQVSRLEPPVERDDYFQSLISHFFLPREKKSLILGP